MQQQQTTSTTPILSPICSAAGIRYGQLQPIVDQQRLGVSPIGDGGDRRLSISDLMLNADYAPIIDMLLIGQCGICQRDYRCKCCRNCSHTAVIYSPVSTRDS